MGASLSAAGVAGRVGGSNHLPHDERGPSMKALGCDTKPAGIWGQQPERPLASCLPSRPGYQTTIWCAARQCVPVGPLKREPVRVERGAPYRLRSTWMVAYGASAPSVAVESSGHMHAERGRRCPVICGLRPTVIRTRSRAPSMLWLLPYAPGDSHQCAIHSTVSMTRTCSPVVLPLYVPHRKLRRRGHCLPPRNTGIRQRPCLTRVIVDASGFERRGAERHDEVLDRPGGVSGSSCNVREVGSSLRDPSPRSVHLHDAEW